jgi:hypothetical protein
MGSESLVELGNSQVPTQLRGNKIGVYTAAAVLRAAAIAEPAETLAGLKAAVNSIRTALKNFGTTE